MKNNIFILVFLLFNISGLFSQDYNAIDSLENLLESTNDDSTRIMLLVYLSDKYKQYDKEKTLNTINKAVEISKDIEFKNLYSFTLRVLGNIQGTYGNMQSSLVNIKKSVEISDQISNNDLNKSHAYMDLGMCYQKFGYYDSAYIFYNKALDIYIKKNSTANIARAYLQLGGLKWMQGDFLTASILYEKTFPLYKEMNDISGKANTLNNVAILYFEMKRYDIAL